MNLILCRMSDAADVVAVVSPTGIAWAGQINKLLTAARILVHQSIAVIIQAVA